MDFIKHRSREQNIKIALLAVLLLILGLTIWWVGYTAIKIGITLDNQILSSSSRTQKPMRVVAVGDMVCAPEDQRIKSNKTCQSDKTYETAKQLNPDAVLGLGDLQYERGTLTEFKEAFDKTWGKLKDIFYPVPGNHEYYTPGARGYFDYFKVANRQHDINVERSFYSFDLGSWHIIALNSNCEYFDCSESGEQSKWLAQDLKNNVRPCTLAFWHYPRYGSGHHAGEEKTAAYTDFFWQKLIDHKAELVINGHEHLYERFGLQNSDGVFSDKGLRQFTVGTGGASLHKRQAKLPNSQKNIDNKFGVLSLQLFSDSYKWEFVGIDGQVLDAGYQDCQN